MNNIVSVEKGKHALSSFRESELHLAEAKHNLIASVNERNRLRLRELLGQLMEVKGETSLDDRQFADLLELVLAKYIENEVESRVHERISGALDRLSFKVFVGG